MTGYKAYWCGEIEIQNATFEFVEDGDTYIAETFDATALLGTDELEAHMNELEAGGVVDVECFLYCYNGANPHIIKIS